MFDEVQASSASAVPPVSSSSRLSSAAAIPLCPHGAGVRDSLLCVRQVDDVLPGRGHDVDVQVPSRELSNTMDFPLEDQVGLRSGFGRFVRLRCRRPSGEIVCTDRDRVELDRAELSEDLEHGVGGLPRETAQARGIAVQTGKRRAASAATFTWRTLAGCHSRGRWEWSDVFSEATT